MRDNLIFLTGDLRCEIRVSGETGSRSWAGRAPETDWDREGGKEGQQTSVRHPQPPQARPQGTQEELYMPGTATGNTANTSQYN